MCGSPTRPAPGHSLLFPLLPTLSPTCQIATVLALEKQGPAALQSLEDATGSGMAGGPLITIPTAYKR